VQWCAGSLLRGNEDVDLPTPESELLGVDAQANKSLADAASPDVAVGSLAPVKHFPPTLLVHGAADPRVSPLQSQRVYDSLAGRGSDVDLILVPRGRHGGAGFNSVVDPCIAFLRKHSTV